MQNNDELNNKMISFLLFRKDNPSDFGFGDSVCFYDDPQIIQLGLLDKIGKIYGFSKISNGKVPREEVIGEGELIVNVGIEDSEMTYWVAENLLGFIDFDPGQTVEIGGREFIRNKEGNWLEVHSIPQATQS